jgi:hypothetical protein
MKSVTITLENGLWLINGKRYQELDWNEKIFFDEFLISIREEAKQTT